MCLLKLTPLDRISYKFSLLFCCIFLIISCSKDSDIFREAVLGDLKEEPDIATDGEDLVSRTVTLSPTSDAYIQNDTGRNYRIIRVEEERRTSYLKFDLSNLHGTVVEAYLEFVIDSDKGNGTIDISKGTNVTWSEENLNANNAPGISDVVGSLSDSYDLGQLKSVSLDASKLYSEQLSLVLSHRNGNDFAIASKENPDAAGPKLIVTYQADAATIAADIASDQDNQDQESNEEGSEGNTEDETGESSSGGTESGDPTGDGNESEESSGGGSESEESSDGGNNSEESTEGNDDSTGSFEEGYFVTVNGSPGNSGLSEAESWDIEYAFENAKAGDIIYIKAGDYGDVRLNADNSGTASNPIKFIGYKNVPGDISVDSGSSFIYNGNSPSEFEMPLLKGSRSNMEGEGTGLSVLEDYVEIYNLQIMYFKRGLGSTGNNVVLDNIVVYEVGDFNPAHSYPTGTNNAFLNYSGAGIVISGSDSRLSNSIVVNAGAEGIRINGGDNQNHFNNAVYSDSTINPTDYYYLIHNGADNNLLRDSFIFRREDLRHNGHGLSLKSEAENNTFINVEIVNTRIEVAKGRVRNNFFKDCTVRGSYDNGRTDGEGGILVANGANRNTFENVNVDNVRNAIRFADWNESSNGGFDEADAGNNNIFKGVTVTNCLNGIFFDNFKEPEGSAHNNTFENCEFSSLRRIFQVNRKNSDNRFLNCKFDEIQDFEATSSKYNIRLNTNTIFDNCTFTNVDFTPPN